jgi:ABC-type Mn2+/Zn2+ transport system permease subunit
LKTITFLFENPELARLCWPGVITGLAVALMCALLSPLAVLKRMGFIGQGISHAAFGGVGFAALAGSLGVIGASGAGTFVIVAAFCLAAAILMARLIDRSREQADTAIGIVLVASMTLGAILLSIAGRIGTPRVRSWESLLFGDLFSVLWSDAIVSIVTMLGVMLVLWWFRRALLFWAFDEATAPAFGVPPRAMKYLLVVLLTLAIVTAMKLAGVVLATALLVLPGATALRLSERLGSVVALSAVLAILGVVLGIVLSFERNLPPGACIVGMMVMLYAIARIGVFIRERTGGRGGRGWEVAPPA